MIESSRKRPIAKSDIRTNLLPLAIFAVACAGCAHIETDAYGVRNLSVEGAKQMSARAVERCLLTIERPSVDVTLGLSAVGCGEPPFDHSAPRISLWRWPWADYQSLNLAILEQDQQRILRWYRARGFYDARIVETRFDPVEAATYAAPPPGACDPAHEECAVDVVVVIDEGEPLRVGDVRVDGLEALSAAARLACQEAPLPIAGARFDEYDYDSGKRALADALAEAAHPAAEVSGTVTLDHQAKRANIHYQVKPGAAYRFGVARVEGHNALPVETIVAAADVPEGEFYEQSLLKEMEQEVYALGAFSAVRVDRELDASTQRVTIIIKVTPLAPDDWRLGVGIMSGALRRTETGDLQSVPQWDIHLFGRYERRHVFGTLGRLSLEDRPRMIFQDHFPVGTTPHPGNLLKVRFNQPGLLENRTDLIFSTQWDVGPDPYLGFNRHDVLGRVSAKRGFLSHELSVTVSLQQDFFIVPAGQMTSDNSELPRSYGYSFVEQDVVLDLRDQVSEPTRGMYLGLTASEAGRWAGSDWSAFRLAPEIRGYLPLPFSMVLAARFAVGAIFIASASPELDETSRKLGPNPYRLRGGGANSNRGFAALQLGAGPQGGIRRWESTLELRVRLGAQFGVVGFGDLGDVNAEPRFRFNLPHPSVGFGFRYQTPVGPIRLDLGFRVGKVAADAGRLPLVGVPGAWHLTIGESF